MVRTAWSNLDGRLHRSIAIVIAILGVLLVVLCGYLGLWRTSESSAGLLASPSSASDADPSSSSEGGQVLRSVDDFEAREGIQDQGQEPRGDSILLQQETPSIAKSPAALEAEAEIGRISRSYDYFRREFDRDSVELPIYALHLMYRCVAVELSAQGRGESWQPPNGEMGSWPETGPDEEQFLVGPRIYRFPKSEFPIFLDLDEWKSSRAPGKRDASTPSERLSMNAAVRAKIDAKVASTLSSLAAIVKTNK